MSLLNIIANVIGVGGGVRILSFTLSTNADNSTAQEIDFVKSGAQSVSVDWGDGTVTTGLEHSHTYASADQYDVVVSCDDVNKITSIISSSGHWNYNVSDLPQRLTSFTCTAADNLIICDSLPNNNINEFILNNRSVVFDTTAIDNILSLFNISVLINNRSGTLNIGGVHDNRSSVSNTAFNNLINSDWDVTVNASDFNNDFSNDFNI